MNAGGVEKSKVTHAQNIHQVKVRIKLQVLRQRAGIVAFSEVYSVLTPPDASADSGEGEGLAVDIETRNLANAQLPFDQDDAEVSVPQLWS